MSVLGGQFAKRQAFGFLYIANLLFSFHLFFLVYINSSFLATFVGERFVGFVFFIGSVFSIISFLYIPEILRKLGNYNAIIIFTLLEILTLAAIAISNYALLAVALFALHLILVRLMIFNFDIFLESYTAGGEADTGKIRGTFLTITNIALLLSPLVAGFMLENGDYSKIYLLSAAFLVPFLYLIASRFRTFKDPHYDDISFLSTLAYVQNDKNVLGIVMSHFLFRLFATFMVIYMPIYLHQHIGFSWPEIGVIFTIMLLPFALFEYTLGRLGDSKVGEKEFLLVGFIILIISVASIPFMSATTIIPWAALLFLTRVGASFIEITTESYFFKHVDGTDTETIGLFRITRPLSFVIGPLIATAALFFVDIQYLFLILSLLLLSGIYFITHIEDTK